MRKIRSTTGVIHTLKPRERFDPYVTTCGRTLKSPRNVEDYKRVDCTNCRRTDPNLDVPTERGLPISIALSPSPKS